MKDKKKKVTFNDVLKKAMNKDGSINASKLEGDGSLGYNGGVACDVTDGPCACGGWHKSGKSSE